MEGDHVIQSKNQPFADLKQSFTTIAQRTGFPEFALVSVKRSLNKASLQLYYALREMSFAINSDPIKTNVRIQGKESNLCE